MKIKRESEVRGAPSVTMIRKHPRWLFDVVFGGVEDCQKSALQLKSLSIQRGSKKDILN